MKTNSQLNLDKISECNDKLQEILENYGIDVFCEAVTELFVTFHFPPFGMPLTSGSAPKK